MKKRITTAVAAASVAGGVVIGSFVAPPMTAFAADTSTEASTTATARTPGQWITDSLKGLVDKGTITQEQSDAVANTLKDAQPKGGHGRGGGFGGFDMTKTAEVLGLSESDLRTELQTKSLATIAGEKNVDVQKVIDALVTAANTRIDQAVTDGKLTQDEASKRKSDIVDRITKSVNEIHVGPNGGPRMNDGPPPPDNANTEGAA
jgi:polyhydroxyalkanoate synthesis regulator phasin